MANTNFSKVLAAGLVVAAMGCNSAKQLTSKADKKFFKTGEYDAAIDLYKQAQAKGGDAAYTNAQIAEAYRITNRAPQALPYYNAAASAGNKVDSITFYRGYAMKAAGQYDSANTVFTQYAKKGGNRRLKAWAKQEVDNYPEVQKILNFVTFYEVQNASTLNTSAADFGPTVVEGNQLLFTSARNSNKIYKANNTPYTNLYTLNMMSGDTAAAKLMEGMNDPEVMQAAATMSRDGQMLVFARSNEGSRKGRRNVDLYVARKKDGKFLAPELLPSPINLPETWESTPAWSPDGKSLYFSSDRPGGQGGADVWRVTYEKGKWGKVTNMGNKINTPGEESFPYVSDDGRLFFSSDGHPGLGGLDVFVATRKEDKSIEVKNLGVPMNSKADDFGITFKNALEGYLSSNREGGKGDDDIYTFRDTKNELKIVKFVTSGVTQERDRDGNVKPLGNTKVHLLDPNGNELAQVTTDAEGRFSFPMDDARTYTFLAEKDGYYARREQFSTYGKGPKQEELTQKVTEVPLTYNLVLDKIVVEQAIVLDNIYYEYNKANITDSAALELDKLVQILKDNPNITIELSSHTDSRGSDDYNLKLSQQRAESAVRYIVSQGIAGSRIVAKGYGETKPVIAEAATEEDFQKNRRTEFKVIKMTGGGQ